MIFSVREKKMEDVPKKEWIFCLKRLDFLTKM